MNEQRHHVDEPTEAVVADLVDAAANARIPDAALIALRGADRPKSGPTTGELWRVRRPDGGAVSLVWVRAVRSSDADVVPVSFDVEMADEASFIVSGEQSPLGLPLAVHAGVTATVDLDTLRDRLGTLDIATTDSSSGPAIVSPLDERIEYRESLVDSLAELASDLGYRERAEPTAGSVVPEEWWLFDDGSQVVELLVSVHAALAGAHLSARITPRPSSAAASEQARAVAQVSELDAFVLVALVEDAGDSDSAALLDVAREVLDADPLLNAVCLAESAPPFQSVLIDRRDVVAAIETPSGELRPPRHSHPPRPIGDALVKFLDTAITPFGRLAGTVVDAQAVDARGLAVEVSAEAVRAVTASARAYKVEGKRPGYERVTRHQASITRLVEEALNRADVDVASMLEEDT